jgi:hypothetical protein
MKRFTIFAVIALVLVFALALGGCGKKDGDSKSAPVSTASSTPSVNMQEGQWEMTTQTNMPGLPAGANKPFTITTCISKKDLVPQEPKQQTQMKSECKMQDKNISGNTVSWTTVCPNTVSKGSYTYAGSTFEGSSQTTIKKDGKEMVMTASVKGKYLGPCPPGQTQPQVKN